MNDLEQIKKLAGITPANSANMQPYNVENSGSNISLTGMEKANIQKEKKIQPGTEDWFRLWFSKPYLTRETPTD
jgi:hypothetical protein